LSSLCAGTAAGAVLDLARLEVAGGTLAAGQCAELALEIENTGAATAGDARVELSLLSGAGQLVAASHALGDVAPGARVTVQGDSLCVEPGARDGETLVVEAHLVHDGGERRLRRALTAGAVRLVHVGQEIDDTDGDGLIEAGERAVVRLEVRNLGGATAAALEAVLEVVERATGLPAASATVERARARFGDLAPGEIARGEPCILRLAPDADPATLLLRVTFDRPLEQQPASPVVAIDLEPPPAPTGIAGALPAAGVRLTWEPVAADDLWGYAIERAPALAGPFTEIAVQAAGAGTRYADPAVVPWRSYAYRVRAVDDSRHRGPPSAAALLASNPPPAAGWPRPLGVETTSSPVLVDLDGDGACEIVIGADGVYVFRGDGSGWLDASGGGARFTSDGVVPAARSYESTAAVADLDGDGALEIAAAAWQRAELHVWRLDGSAVDGWPRSLIGPPNWGSPVAADLDADGDLELVVLSGAQGRLFAWHHDGREVRDGDGDPTTDGVFAHSGAAFSFATPAAGDVDGEPGAEIVVGYDAPAGALHVYRADGSEPPGWPLALGGPISASPALADLDDDGRLEILVAVEETDSVYVLDGDGRPRSGWPRPATVRNAAARTSSPVVADLDGDGRQDVVFADNAGLLHAWDRDGEVLSGWEAVTFATDIEAQGAHATQSTPVIGDLDGEPGLEVVLGAEDGRVYAWHAGGSPVRGFPIQTAGEVRGSPALGDVDGDGQVELVVGASDQQLGVWDVAGDPLRQPWPLFRRTPANDGNASASGLLAPEEPQRPGAAPAPARIGRPHPSPARPTTRLDLTLDRPEAVEWRLYGVAGRLLRRERLGRLGAGEHPLEWDGRDGAGRPLPAGVYWFEVRAGAARRASRIVLVR
ncbi:MAG: FG-GAP-like repeat-containing protein, partial [Candidatus Eiseniibacteriota bacterium]